MATGYQYWEAEPSEKEIEAANRECLKNLKGAYEPAVPEHFKPVTLEAKPIFLDKPYEEQYSKDAPPPLPTKLFPQHKMAMLTHNDHKIWYGSIEALERNIEAWERILKAGTEAADPVPFGWVSVEQREKAIATDSMWGLLWYSETPVEFHRLFACDLDVLLEKARDYEEPR